MKSATLAKLFAVLGVLLLLLYWRTRPVDRMGAAPETVALFEAKKNDFDRFKVTGPGKVTELKLSGARWKVNLNGEWVDADDSQVAPVAAKLRDLSTSEMISEGKDLKRYGLDKAQLVELVFYKGAKTLASLKVGNPGVGYQGNYLQFKGRPGVYLYRESIRGELDRMPLEFREKRLFGDLNKEDVVSLNLQSASGSVKLKKEAEGWTLLGVGEGQKADTAAVENYLGQSLNIRSMEEVAPADWAHMLTSSVVLTLTLGAQVGAPLKIEVLSESVGLLGRQGVISEALNRPAAIYSPQAANLHKAAVDFLPPKTDKPR